MKKPRMTGVQMSHLGVLLWMEYKPSEIAEEIKCNTDTLYKSYIPAGCPHKWRCLRQHNWNWRCPRLSP